MNKIKKIDDTDYVSLSEKLKNINIVNMLTFKFRFNYYILSIIYIWRFCRTLKMAWTDKVWTQGLECRLSDYRALFWKRRVGCNGFHLTSNNNE